MQVKYRKHKKQVSIYRAGVKFSCPSKLNLVGLSIAEHFFLLEFKHPKT